MKEILVGGNPIKDFKRLGVDATLTYGNDKTDYKVYEVTDESFKILCEDALNEEVAGEWENCGWRYAEGSNLDEPTEIVSVNGKDLKCWFKYDEEELKELEKGEKYFIPSYPNLLEYFVIEMGCALFKNVCALAKDLAKYNNMKMSELFKVYQGQ